MSADATHSQPSTPAGTRDVRPWPLTLALLAGEQVDPPEPLSPGPRRSIRAGDRSPHGWALIDAQAAASAP